MLSTVFCGRGFLPGAAGFRLPRWQEQRLAAYSTSWGLCVAWTIRSRPPHLARVGPARLAISNPADAGSHGFGASSGEESPSLLRAETRQRLWGGPSGD